tara:strand:- start:1338 stop:1958 length:621 start_codon:yes stop_codon:yes gene_type:complete
MDYKKQYLKYKLKYLILKKLQTGGTKGSTVSSKQSKDKIGSGSTHPSDDESFAYESDDESCVSQTEQSDNVSRESKCHPVDPLPQEGGSGSGIQSVYVESEPEQPEPLIFEYNSGLPFCDSVPEGYIKIINYREGDQYYCARVEDKCEVIKKLENEDYSIVESKEDTQTVFTLTKNNGQESSDEQSYTSPSPPLSCEKPALPNSSH